MQIDEKTAQLRGRIREALDRVVTRDYVLLDAPYYNNIGDVLIWQGTLDYLRGCPHRCLYMSSCGTYRKPAIGKDVVVLLQGGGNFGDLWRGFQEFRLRVLEDFPDNPVVILPQSVHYDDPGLMRRDAEAFARHPNLTVFARDKAALELLERHFPASRNLLIPDMAFYTDMSRLYRRRGPLPDRALLLRRGDKEGLGGYDVPAGADVSDWPTMMPGSYRVMDFLLRGVLSVVRRATGGDPRVADFLYCRVMRPAYLKIGARFIARYGHVYSTRLHGAVLSVMMGRRVTMLDNSYGKNGALYDAWLSDLDSIEMAGPQATLPRARPQMSESSE